MKLCMHVAGAAVFGSALYYDICHLRVPDHLKNHPVLSPVQAWPGKWKYLTFWNLIMLFAYQLFSIANDIYGSSVMDSKKRTEMQKIRDFCFASLNFPVGIFVSISFWGLYIFDRKLVYPEVMDEFNPSWVNHAVHTGPALFMLAESFLVPKIFPKRSTSILGNATFTTVYLSWILVVAKVSNVWVYPILEVLNLPARAVFLGGCVLIMSSLYFVGELLQKIIRGNKGMSYGENKTGRSKKAR